MHRSRLGHALIVGIAALTAQACTPHPRAIEDEARATGQPSGRVPLWDDLGAFHRPVTTPSADAQRYFDQGLLLAYAFNHDAALLAYEEAATIDPNCGMAWWGIAHANGPHINLPVQDPARAQRALRALERARACEGLAEVEVALIEAQAARFSEDARADRKTLDRAYGTAMAGVWRRFPRDADVGVLYAESLMNVNPWDLWTPDGQPKHDALEIVATLEAVRAFAPDHPQANHLYIHAVEASREPERAIDAADRLRHAAPGASHLVHMPSHIDVLTGRFQEASEANERAIAADEKHGRATARTGFYQVYMAHNRHMLAFASMMEGRQEAALRAARDMVAQVPPEFLAGDFGPAIDGLMPVVLHTLVRFGRWEEVLAEPPFGPELLAANAVRSYARGVALAALGRLDEAQAELDALTRAAATMDDRPIGNTPAKQVLQVPLKVLEGELLFRRGQQAEGIAALREAAVAEETLTYAEPPDWMQPVRHTLAATLLVAGRPVEAEQAAREDLRRFPKNIWSLTGLAKALRAQGRAGDAQEVEAELGKLRERADVDVPSPCLCQPG